MFSVVCDYSKRVAGSVCVSKNNFRMPVCVMCIVCDDVVALGTSGELQTDAGHPDVLKSLSEHLETLSNLCHVKTHLFRH